MPSENFVPLYSTDNVYYASDTDRCLTDDLDALADNISALDSTVAGKANVVHSHNGYATISHTHSEYAYMSHTHNYAEVEHTHDIYSMTDHTHSEYAMVNHSHSNYEQTVSNMAASYSNPNLLINGDFQVWQRGTSFTNFANRYTADRWMIKNAKGNTALVERSTDVPDSETIQYSMHIQETLSENSYLRYYFENPMKGIYTLSFWYKNDVEINSYIYDNNTLVHLFKLTPSTTWTKKTYTFTATSMTFINIIQAMKVGNCYIAGVKLEQGTIATAFSPKPYWEELASCMRYYRYAYRTPIFTTGSTGTTYFMPLRFSPYMRTNPTKTLVEVLNSGLTVQSGVTLSRSTSSVYNMSNIQLSATVGQYGYVTMAFDAEIY